MTEWCIMCKDEILTKLKRYKACNAEKFGIVALGVFGSVARGTERDDSDIDICIKIIEPNPLYLVRIKSELEELFKRHVDIVRVREKMNAYLKENIEKQGLYV